MNPVLPMTQHTQDSNGISAVVTGCFRQLVFILSLVFPQFGFGKDAEWIASVLPSDTLAMARIEDWNGFRQLAAELPMGQLYLSPDMQRFRDELNEKGGGYLLDTFGIDIETVDQFIAGEFVMAGLPSVTEVMSIVTFVQAGDETSAQALAVSMNDRLMTNGVESLDRPPELPEAAMVYQLDDRPNDPFAGGLLIVCPKEDYVILSRDVSIATSLIRRWDDDSRDEGLAGVSAYQSTMMKLDGLHPNHLVKYYLDPIAWGVMSDQVTSDNSDISLVPLEWRDEDGRPVPFPRRHGLASLHAVAGAAWRNEATGMLEFEILVQTPPDRFGVMGVFDFVGGELVFPAWMAETTAVATVVRSNMESVLPNIAGIFDDITNATGAFDATMSDLKRELNVDLQGELMPALGPEIGIMSGFDEATQLDSTVVGIKIKNPAVNEPKIAKMLYQLLANDTEAGRSRIPRQKYELWQVKLLVGSDQSSFSQAGLMVADGHLWIATHTPTLRRMLLRAGSPTLQDSSINQEFMKVIDPHRTSASFGMSLSRMDIDSKQAYETLRVDGPLGLRDVESIYSTLLQVLIDEENSMIDFSLMPAFDDVKSNLHNLAVIGNITDEGWSFRGIVFPGNP
ncbi:MAG: hypothetical protein AAF670_03450 [Planctomycetota bacterium]